MDCTMYIRELIKLVINGEMITNISSFFSGYIEQYLACNLHCPYAVLQRAVLHAVVPTFFLKAILLRAIFDPPLLKLYVLEFHLVFGWILHGFWLRGHRSCFGPWFRSSFYLAVESVAERFFSFLVVVRPFFSTSRRILCAFVLFISGFSFFRVALCSSKNQ